MFSFQPLVDTECTLHGGFWVLAIVFGVFWLVVYTYYLAEEIKWYGLVIYTIFAGFTLFHAYNESYVQPPNCRIYKNEKVIGKLVGFIAEGETVSVRQGKNTSLQDRHYTYVSYFVNGQQVILQSSPGAAYPEQAILYKN